MRRRPQAPDASSTDNPGGAEPGPAPLRGIEESFAFVLLTKRGRSAPVPTSGSATKIAACHRVQDRCAIRCRRPEDLCASECFGATGSRQCSRLRPAALGSAEAQRPDLGVAGQGRDSQERRVAWPCAREGTEPSVGPRCRFSNRLAHNSNGDNRSTRASCGARCRCHPLHHACGRSCIKSAKPRPMKVAPLSRLAHR